MSSKLHLPISSTPALLLAALASLLMLASFPGSAALAGQPHASKSNRDRQKTAEQFFKRSQACSVAGRSDLALVEVTRHFLDLGYCSEGDTSYTEIVLVSRLQALEGTEHGVPMSEWVNVPAFAKVGVEPEINIIDIEGVADDVQNIEVMFLS